MSHSNSDEIDEVFEVKAATKLLLRGYGAAILCGAIYHLPVQSTIATAVQILATGFLLYVSCLPLIIASTVIRNVIWRRIPLKPNTRIVIVAGILILLVLLMVAAKAFGLGGLVY